MSSQVAKKFQFVDTDFEVRRRKYECVVVIRPSLNDAELKEEINWISNCIDNLSSGKSKAEAKFWGKKELGFERKKCHYGYYVCFNFQAEDMNLVGNLTQQLRIRDAVLLFETHRLETLK